MFLFFSYCAIYLNDRRVDYVTFCFVILFYVLLILTRAGYGTDELVYRAAYNDYLNSSSNFDFEYSFRFLFEIFKFFGVKSEYFNNAIGMLHLFLISLIIVRHIKSPYRSLCMVFLVFNYVSLDLMFNIYRQGLALWVLLLAIFSFLEKKILYFFIFAFVSVGFHWSAGLIIGLFIISNINYNYGLKHSITVLTCVVVFVFMVEPKILTLLIDLISMLSLSEFLVAKLRFYLDSDNSSLYDLNVFGRVNNLIMPFLFLIFTQIFYERIPRQLTRFIVLVNVYCVVFIEIAYSYRNYYWLLLLLPFLICHVLSVYKLNTKDLKYISFIFCVLHLSVSVLTYYSLVTFSMVFLA
ncbi:EpsG family protein [Aeromonas sp. Y293-4]|uniref:EpsG family protein n=1 Tax=Aeromonas sp. Y293-4 TaxID=2990504 RepID=UPI0022DFB532|nr:EpsG family protein [Aeromonas sp. Y293-4]